MPDVTRWVSVDPAKATGVAVWDGDLLVGVATVSPSTKTDIKNAKKVNGLEVGDDPYTVTWMGTSGSTVVVFPTMLAAYFWIVGGAARVVIEHSMGPRPKSVSQIAWRRGYLAALAAVSNVPTTEVNTSEWRRVVTEAWGWSWPRDSKLCKELAIRLAQEHFGCSEDIGGDEADAVLVGHWAVKTGTVRSGFEGWFERVE